MEAAMKENEQGIQDLKELKKKAAHGLIAAKRSGKLDELAQEMDAIGAQEKKLEAEEAALKKREESLALRAKAKQGLLAAKKNGELDALAEEMDAMAREKEALAKAKAEAQALKAKARDGLLKAKRDGQLEEIALGMEETQK